ncbi:MAG: histidine kinase [Treponemataceae bacterium]|nr:histidine kinase [Treponemataceae bacterium]
MKLLVYFGILTSVQVLVLLAYSVIHVSTVLKRNTSQLTEINLAQTAANFDLLTQSYMDLIYQIWTGDDFVAWLDAINADTDVSVVTNQMRRQMRAILNSKEYIRSITIISASGKVITYDTLTSATYENSWLENFSLSQDELYSLVSRDNAMHLFPTEYATTFTNEDQYLFHIAHRIIDWKKLNKQCGIVILSLDEALLSDIIAPESISEEDYALLTGRDGRIISAQDKSIIGKVFRQEEVPSAYSVYSYTNDDPEWTFVQVKNETQNKRVIIQNILISSSISLGSLLVTLSFIWNISGQLTHSISAVVEGMGRTRKGSLPEPLSMTKDMSPEIINIVSQYNRTIDRLDQAIQREKEENASRQQAEIRMLEARINPHFIYNTLDTVNWMAIDKEEYDMSNAISSLATILRYAISNSNKIVTVRDEVEWLKRYIYLQQYRMKNQFVCNIDAAENIMDWPVHKLLIQPFVENAIIHGFENAEGVSVLDVIMLNKNDELSVTIRDNGKGMDEKLTRVINSGSWKQDRGTLGIGIYNALMRLHMYCDGQERVHVTSSLGKGTEITVLFPVETDK